MNKIKKDEYEPEENLDVENATAVQPNAKTVMSKKKIIIGIIVLGIVAVAAIYFVKIGARGINTSGYQAVFLNNGQVYFGKLSDEDDLYPVLRDVYYLQVSQPSQPLQGGEAQPANMSLVKLGGELHGPTDEMRINRSQILFIENMRSDSRVVQLIFQYKKGSQ